MQAFEKKRTQVDQQTTERTSRPGFKTTFMAYLLVGLALCAFSARAGETKLYYYQGKDYGSEAIFNPLTVITNGGFGILQISNRSNKFSDVDFRRGYKNVTYNLSHPFKAIEQLGWNNFLSREVIPTSVKFRNAQYYPNYYNHLIGGGFTYRALTDWYRYHQFPQPRIWAFTSWFAYHFLNEVVENNRYSGPNVDPISDFYVFNTAGFILFSFDKVAGFFANTLNMRDWSFMPAIDPWLGSIENNGQNFMTRIKLPYVRNLSLMYHWGTHGMYGLSYHRKRGNTYSLAGGLVVKDLVEIKDDGSGHGVRELTATLVWTAGVFWDHDNSLMSSLILSGTKGYKARLNIYPGVVKLGKFSPGFFLNLRKDNQMVLGLHYMLPVGLGRRVR